MRNVAHEAPVDLELVDRETLQVGQRGIAGAEIVDGQADAEIPQCVELCLHVRAALHERALRDLKLEVAGRQPRFREDGLQALKEIGLLELPAREIDRDRAELKARI